MAKWQIRFHTYADDPPNHDPVKTVEADDAEIGEHGDLTLYDVADQPVYFVLRGQWIDCELIADEPPATFSIPTGATVRCSELIDVATVQYTYGQPGAIPAGAMHSDGTFCMHAGGVYVNGELLK